MGENIGSLASVYHQSPETFVKRLRDIQNQLKEMQDNDYQVDGDPDELLQQENQFDYGAGEPAPVTVLKQETNLLDDDLLGNEPPATVQPV